MTQAPQNGWHWREWAAELVGTAILLYAVVTAKDWAVRAGTPFSDLEVRICIVGTVAGAVVAMVAVSRLGRRSGAHLNPAVTIGLWLQGTVGAADVAGYSIAQVIGGTAGVAIAAMWGSTVTDSTVNWAVIAPSLQISQTAAAAIEAGAVVIQLVCVFALLTSRRYQRLTPVVAGVLLALFIALLAQTSGAGFNPVRGLAPDILAGTYPAVWIYFAGPLVGCVAAALVIRLRGWHPLTGKLCHDPTIPCYMRCELPHAVTDVPVDSRLSQQSVSTNH